MVFELDLNASLMMRLRMKYIYGLFVGLVTAVALGWVIHFGL